MSEPVQAVTKALQPPLSVGSLLVRRCAMVAKSIATSCTFIPMRRIRSSVTWHMAARVWFSMTARMTTFSPAYPASLSAAFALSMLLVLMTSAPSSLV